MADLVSQNYIRQQRKESYLYFEVGLCWAFTAYLTVSVTWKDKRFCIYLKLSDLKGENNIFISFDNRCYSGLK